jgi:radical SAM superfamily enzyme
MAKYGVTEQDAFAMCRQEGLLSPLYEYSHRGGCWFCPNASMTELRHLYRAHPDLWQLMLELQDAPNKATERFNRNFTFAELDLRFRLEGEQLSFYDQVLEVER